MRKKTATHNTTHISVSEKEVSLITPLEQVIRINSVHKKALARLRIQTVGDLMYHFPTRYGDTSEIKNIASLTQGENAVVFGKISNLETSKGFKSKLTMASGIITDDTGSLQAVWFNQPYLAKMIHNESLVRIDGKVSERKKGSKKGQLYMSNPKIEVVHKVPLGVGDSLFGQSGEEHSLYPVYPESRGISSLWLHHALERVFKTGILDRINDPIPEHIRSKYNLPTLSTSLIWIHAPKKLSDATSARKRFSFEEIFFIQLQKKKDRKEFENEPSWNIRINEQEVQKFIERFPFTPTEAQLKAVQTILNDLKKGHAMSRLLEGDVGSGKTAVAAASVYAVTTSTPAGRQFGHLQTAYMCPTEILATQQFESFISYFSFLPINIGLITGSGCRKFPSKLNPKGWTDISRSQFLKWVASGDIHIVVGTHALIQKTVKFKNLAYTIIDEQHRFGTSERKKLARKESALPHLLSMTATPIPRTLALTLYGDLDLTLLDSMPPGRKPVITDIVPPSIESRNEVYEKIRAELTAGRQAYVICPRINEPDPTREMSLIAKSVIAEAERLRTTVFKGYTVGVLHGKMTPDQKDQAMLDFKNGLIHILCATSVVEVGVNVPNANSIIIEGGERFGLAQLHQLRGRVIRGNHQPYCYVFTESSSEKTAERLSALRSAHNGFELAEYDLKFRGAGDLYGTKQWGISDIGMEALQNIKIVEAARQEAAALLEQDSTLVQFPHTAAELAIRTTEPLHFE